MGCAGSKESPPKPLKVQNLKTPEQLETVQLREKTAGPDLWVSLNDSPSNDFIDIQKDNSEVLIALNRTPASQPRVNTTSRTVTTSKTESNTVNQLHIVRDMNRNICQECIWMPCLLYAEVCISDCASAEDDKEATARKNLSMALKNERNATTAIFSSPATSVGAASSPRSSNATKVSAEPSIAF